MKRTNITKLSLKIRNISNSKQTDVSGQSALIMGLVLGAKRRFALKRKSSFIATITYFFIHLFRFKSHLPLQVIPNAIE